MDVVRPQPGPPPQPGCLRGLAHLGLALLLGGLALLAGVHAFLAMELGGIDGPGYAVLSGAVSGGLAVAAVAVLVRLVRRR